jgi:hypothetical protein
MMKGWWLTLSLVVIAGRVIAQSQATKRDRFTESKARKRVGYFP